jgi:ABC-2 type transport system permease protein
VLVVRSGFDVPWWELLLSMGLLVMAFLGMVWVAGRIYRTGILMYGKKVTWKELGKWIFYKG